MNFIRRERQGRWYMELSGRHGEGTLAPSGRQGAGAHWLSGRQRKGGIHHTLYMILIYFVYHISYILQYTLYMHYIKDKEAGKMAPCLPERAIMPFLRLPQNARRHPPCLSLSC